MVASLKPIAWTNLMGIAFMESQACTNVTGRTTTPSTIWDLRRTRPFTLHRPSDIWTSSMAAAIQAVLAALAARSIVGCGRESPSASLPTQFAIGTRV